MATRTKDQQRFWPGTQLVIRSRFVARDHLGNAVPTTPTVVFVAVKDPLGTVFYLPTSSPAEGVVEALVTVQEPGYWTWRVQTASNIVAASEGDFWVEASQVL